MLRICLFIFLLFISNTICSFDKPSVIVLTDIGDDTDDEQISQVNRNPLVAVNSHSQIAPLFVEAKTGSRLVFDASQTKDPDNDSIEFKWFFYEELSFPGCVDFQLSQNANICSFTVPESMKGRTHHLIVEVTDNGAPSLKGYKRIIINVL